MIGPFAKYLPYVLSFLIIPQGFTQTRFAWKPALPQIGYSRIIQLVSAPDGSIIISTSDQDYGSAFRTRDCSITRLQPGRQAILENDVRDGQCPLPHNPFSILPPTPESRFNLIYATLDNSLTFNSRILNWNDGPYWTYDDNASIYNYPYPPPGTALPTGAKRAVRTIAVSPHLSSQKKNYLFAGTERDRFYTCRDKPCGPALYRSEDGGKEWSPVSLDFLTEHDVLEIAADLSSGTLFAILDYPNGRYGALFRSKNDGMNWEQVLLFPEVQPKALLVHSDGSIYVTTSDRRIHFSKDSGKTWATKLVLSASSQLSQGSYFPIAINDWGHIFVGLPEGGFMSTDEGNNWERISPRWSDRVWSDGSDENGNAVTAVTIDHEGYLYVGTPRDGLFRSIQSTGDGNPNKFLLEQNFPNPFNSQTVIPFTLAEDTDVSLKIYNTLGQKTAELANGPMKAGPYAVHFDASRLPSGTYFYTLRAGSFQQTKKFLLLK